jgi:hypothetical protein
MSPGASAPTSIKSRPLGQMRTSHAVASKFPTPCTRGRESIIFESESEPCLKHLANATHSSSLVPWCKALLAEPLRYRGADGWPRCNRGTNGFEPVAGRPPPRSLTARSGIGTDRLARAVPHQGNALRIHGPEEHSDRPRATGGCGGTWPGAGRVRLGPGLNGFSAGSSKGS